MVQNLKQQIDQNCFSLKRKFHQTFAFNMPDQIFENIRKFRLRIRTLKEKNIFRTVNYVLIFPTNSVLD